MLDSPFIPSHRGEQQVPDQRDAAEQALGKAPEKTNKFWGFLNSEFGKWLIPAIATAVIPLIWSLFDPFGIQKKLDQDKALTLLQAKQQQAEVKRREDSQFLTQLLPALAGSDQRMLKRAILVIQARYPFGEVPNGVQRLLVAVALDTLTNTPQVQELAVGALDNIPLAQLDPGVAVSIKQLPPTVYFQIFDEGQRPQAKTLGEALSKQGFLVPGVENVGATANPVATAEIRYFPADASIAQRVREIMRQRGVTDILLRPLSKRLDKRRISRPLEIWLPSQVEQPPKN